MSQLRTRLFNSIAAESLRNQNDKNFVWCISVATGDDETKRNVDGIDCLFFNHSNWAEMAKIVGREKIRMMRFDDDDAIRSDFVEQLRKEPFREGHWLTFPNGYRSHNGRIYKKRNLPNQFVSLDVIAKSGNHVYEINHRDLEKTEYRDRLHIVSDHPVWLWTRHAESKSSGGKVDVGSERLRNFNYSAFGIKEETIGSF